MNSRDMQKNLVQVGTAKMRSTPGTPPPKKTLGSSAMFTSAGMIGDSSRYHLDTSSPEYLSNVGCPIRIL